ncbi:imidazole glycerol phosphate synthase subunit HisH [Candidatus Micrarchaeota archaeon CG08_land_8_20_14_0_20_49_17]|nr:MAG: imidazole glycerol phosphate synthase subunit HisH [Candidatus Micrarchaeota archaeon CG1_02_49_24]PIU09550.1 MAG: imidazole glycerol phosphate synthase subunit HisH [Candidatus Micrarchaeota archaeon CG08_land_8_20_14_0_20_49_17]PIZ94985.1 MAG: imidazole glycerol phosphate synthase subunit HisH [Candidatus Micrarchaeota archaeon CG_4_10_14_0_2_um_filter_49_7]
MKISIIDYNAGNLRSIEKAFAKLGCEATVTKNPAGWKNSDALVLPGQGTFANIKSIKAQAELVDIISTGKPFLGICLGLQLLFEKSEESKEKGLGLLKGTVELMKPNGNLNVPQMGWNTLLFRVSGFGSCLLDGIKETDYFYFVHSYVVKKSPAAAALTDYGGKFVSVIEKGNIFATQFHPEKSGETGFRVLRNFLNAVKH